MRIVIDTKPVSKFFSRVAASVQTKRLERCARILANAEAKKVDRIVAKAANEAVQRTARKPQAVKRRAAKR